MKTYICVICGFIYDEEKGLPDEGIPPGTKWEDVPPNWVCPECGARKEDFEMMARKRVGTGHMRRMVFMDRFIIMYFCSGGGIQSGL